MEGDEGEDDEDEDDEDEDEDDEDAVPVSVAIPRFSRSASDNAYLVPLTESPA